jgi:parvulin-like peptidyl-prolyl isomerase
MRKIDNEMDKIKDIERKKQEEKMIKRQKEKFYKEQKQKIMEYKSKRQATEDLLANANVLDYEENYSEEGEDEGDALDRMVNGMANKSKPPAVS